MEIEEWEKLSIIKLEEFLAKVYPTADHYNVRISAKGNFFLSATWSGSYDDHIVEQSLKPEIASQICKFIKLKL